MKRKVIIGGVIGLLIVVLAGAAFVAGRLLNGQGADTAGGGGPNMVLKGNGPGGAVSVKLNIEPAKELPSAQPETHGIFDHRADSSIFVGTGQIQMMVQKKADGTVSMSSNHDGPVIEVVVAHDTIVYRDVTMKDGALPPDQQSGEVKKQQIVEPGNIDEIAENSQVTVWGERRGDRIIAKTVVYTPPPVLNAGK